MRSRTFQIVDVDSRQLCRRNNSAWISCGPSRRVRDEGPGSTLLLDHLVSAAVSSLADGYGITDLQHCFAESGATIFLALVERCRSADRRDQHFEFVDKARSIVVELGWFVWNRSHLVYVIETMCAIATRKYGLSRAPPKSSVKFCLAIFTSLRLWQDLHHKHRRSR